MPKRKLVVVAPTFVGDVRAINWEDSTLMLKWEGSTASRLSGGTKSRLDRLGLSKILLTYTVVQFDHSPKVSEHIGRIKNSQKFQLLT